jgi:choline dehydrogenase-like flavoprotein
MIRDARDLEDDAELTADVCIAGAGAAGITLARELRGRGLSVIVLESGDLEGEAAIQDLYEGIEVGPHEVGLRSCRVRQFGGSTNAWAGWCRRLTDDDFEARPWLEGSGWPLTAEEMAPWYDRAHELCEIGADDFDVAAMADRDDTIRPMPLDPTRVETAVYQFSPPTRFGTRYRRSMEDADDVEVYLRANLVDIRLDETGDCDAFVAATLDGGRFTVRASRFVLAMGGIANARMLLASNTQEPAGVGNGNDLVGRYFMEHPHFYWTAWLAAPADLDLDLYVRYPTTLTYDDASPDGVSIRVRGALALPQALRASQQRIALAATLRPDDLESASDRTGSVPGKQLRAVLRGGDIALYGLDVRAEQRPIPESRVTLALQRDALGVPITQMDWRIAQADIADTGATLRQFGVELARAGIGRLWMPTGPEGYEPVGYNVGCHHMGTTRMAASPDDGVVDADCRVHGVPSLFVAGSSVFTTGGFANPTLTIVALAVRLADTLAAELA